MNKIKWDGITEIGKIKPALLGFITEEEKQQAKKTAYGYFTDIIRKNHRNSGTNSGGLFVYAFCEKITVHVDKIEYYMTWNKAAKYICQWLNEENLTISNKEENLRLDMGMNGACEVNKMSSTKSANLTISNKEENIMENQVITQNQEIIITENYSRAVSLHRKICANAQAAQESLFEVCKGLKEMRDSKLYKELNYSEFNDYCKSELGMTDRTAYKYISIAENLSENLVKSTSLIGTEKLYLLAKLDEPERAEIIQNNDLESTSIKELKSKISELKKANDRLLEKASQAEKNAEDSRKKEADAWGKVSVLKTDSEMQIKKISQLERQLEELENRPVEVAVKDNSEEVEKLKNQLEQEIKKLKADNASEIDSMKTRHNQEKSDFMREKNELNERFRSKHKEWLQACNENAALTGQLYHAKEKIKELENSSDNSAKFNVYHQNCINAVNQLFDFMIKTDGSEKFMDKIYELSDYINSRIENID